MPQSDDGRLPNASQHGQQDQPSTPDLEAGQNTLDLAISSENDSTTESERPSVDNAERISTHVSLGPDNPVDHYTSFFEIPDEVYDRFPPHRKVIIVILLSFCSFLAPISSTTVLSATPEVAAEYGTTGSIVDLTNALYMLFMGISPLIWGPFSEVYGRRHVSDLQTSNPSGIAEPPK